jgi:hypothetical protein
MTEDSTSKNTKYAWFRWIPRCVLLLASFLPFFYLAFYNLVIELVALKYWTGWELLWGIPIILLISIQAWFFPIKGGIIAILTIHLVIIYIAAYAAAGSGRMEPFLATFLKLEYISVVLGGVLSIAWGVIRRMPTRPKNSARI